MACPSSIEVNGIATLIGFHGIRDVMIKTLLESCSSGDGEVSSYKLAGKRCVASLILQLSCSAVGANAYILTGSVESMKYIFASHFALNFQLQMAAAATYNIALAAG